MSFGAGVVVHIMSNVTNRYGIRRRNSVTHSWFLGDGSRLETAVVLYKRRIRNYNQPCQTYLLNASQTRQDQEPSVSVVSGRCAFTVRI